MKRRYTLEHTPQHYRLRLYDEAGVEAGGGTFPATDDGWEEALETASDYCADLDYEFAPDPAPEASPPSQRLGVLTHPLEQCQALLLESLRVTHADVLRFDAISHNYQLGIRCVSGDFTHLPSGRRYIVAIAGIPPEAV